MATKCLAVLQTQCCVLIFILRLHFNQESIIPTRSRDCIIPDQWRGVGLKIGEKQCSNSKQSVRWSEKRNWRQRERCFGALTSYFRDSREFSGIWLALEQVMIDFNFKRKIWPSRQMCTYQTYCWGLRAYENKTKQKYPDEITIITKTLGLSVSVEVVLKSHDSK